MIFNLGLALTLICSVIVEVPCLQILRGAIGFFKVPNRSEDYLVIEHAFDIYIYIYVEKRLDHIPIGYILTNQRHRLHNGNVLISQLQASRTQNVRPARTGGVRIK